MQVCVSSSTIAPIGSRSLPEQGAGRRPYLHFRGLLGLHLRYHPSDRSTAQGGLCHKAPAQPVAKPSRSSATRSIDNSLGGIYLHWQRALSGRTPVAPNSVAAAKLESLRSAKPPFDADPSVQSADAAQALPQIRRSDHPPPFRPQIPIGRRLFARAPPTRGFLPWRLSDACLSARICARAKAGMDVGCRPRERNCGGLGRVIAAAQPSARSMASP